MSLLIDRNVSNKNATNLAILNRHDSNTVEIIDDATHVAIYRFDASQSKWERLGVEGAFFITKRSVPPFNRLIVLNRLGPENFDLDISAITKIKSQPPYVMIRCSTSGAPSIFGLWFHDIGERDRILEIINKLLSDIVASPGTDPLTPNKPNAAVAPPPTKGTSVLALLSSAFKDKAKVSEEISLSPPPPPPVSMPLPVASAPTATASIPTVSAMLAPVPAPAATCTGLPILMSPSDFTGVSVQAPASERNSTARNDLKTQEVVAAVLSELSTDAQFVDMISRRLATAS